MKMYDPEIWFNETNGYEELLENIKASFAAKMKDNIKTPYKKKIKKMCESL